MARSSSGILVCSERGSLGFAAVSPCAGGVLEAPQTAARHSDRPRVPENSFSVPHYAVSRRVCEDKARVFDAQASVQNRPRHPANVCDAQAFVEHPRLSPSTPSVFAVLVIKMGGKTLACARQSYFPLLTNILISRPGLSLACARGILLDALRCGQMRRTSSAQSGHFAKAWRRRLCGCSLHAKG